MFVLAKRNIIIPAVEPGAAPVTLHKDLFATVPEWAAQTPYFQQLVKDGKLIVTDKGGRAKSRSAKTEAAPEDKDVS